MEDIERKLVTERRGGYCFEQNLLLKAAFEALGAEVDMFLARTRVGAERGVVRPRSHILSCASARAAQTGTPTWGWAPAASSSRSHSGRAPHRSSLAGASASSRTAPSSCSRQLTGDEWVDLYGFLPQPVPLIDVETSNWWTSTHPRSRFVTGLIVGIRNDDGTGTLLCDWSDLSLSEQTPTGTSVTPLEREAIPELLATRFSLPGFALGRDDRLVRVAAGAVDR